MWQFDALWIPDGQHGSILHFQTHIILLLYSKLGNHFKFVGFLAFSNSTKYFEYENHTNGIYMMVTSHHGYWTYNSICIISIMDKYSVATKLVSGKQFDENVVISVDDDNHRIAVTNNGPASLHCALYQLLKINRGD